MPLPKKDVFLTEVLSFVKFPFDRDTIRSELEYHIIDKIDFYIGEGYDEETAEQLSIANMGEPSEIGIALNKEHNPILGYLWLITNTIATLLICINVYLLVFFLLIPLFHRNPIYDFSKSDIVYRIDINEKVKIDDKVIHFTNIIYDVNGDMNIFYKSYHTKLLGAGWWNSSYIGEITDNLGTTYLSGGGPSRSGIITKGYKSVNNFSKEADTLIINYDMYNRKYHVEIPLKVGEYSE